MDALPKHGGDIAWASARFAIPTADWLDLSTGISPWSWPVEQWPQHVFRALPPQSLVELQGVAARYYGCDRNSVLPVPGSQYAISQIPKSFDRSTVAVPQLGYQEHAQAWLNAGHQVFYYRDFDELWGQVEAGSAQNVVLINPNNPSAECVSRAAVLRLQERLAQVSQKRGLMVVDEAFMDVDPQHSMAGVTDLANTIVLRSFGKFFGLAGVRLGFVIDHSGQWVGRLKEQAGPWLIGHPAVWVAQQALQDSAWIVQQRQRVAASSEQLVALMAAHFAAKRWAGECRNGGLFVTTLGAAPQLYDVFVQLAARGILVRFGQLNEANGWLRIGLCEDFAPLQLALQDIHK